MRPHHSILPALALALALALPAAAEETTSPAARLQARLDKLPAPSREHAFEFKGTAVFNGQPMGTIAFTAAPGDDGETWNVSDAFSIAGGAMERTSTAVLDRRLEAISGRIEGKEPESGPFAVVWRRTDFGFEAKTTVTKDGQETTSGLEIAHAGGATTTMASLWLFARMTLPERGEFAVAVVDPHPGGGEEAVETATWSQGEEGTWKEKKVLLLSGRKGTRTIEAAFDPETHDLVGARLVDPAKGTTFEIRPGAPSAEEDDLYARPAKSAVEVALQAALGFATADLELIDRVFDWPSIHAQEKARYDLEHAGQEDAEPFPDVDAFRADTLEDLKQQLTANPRPMIEAALKMAAPQIKTESVTGGFTKVTFPPMFRNLVMIVGQVDGAWHLVRAPTTGQ